MLLEVPGSLVRDLIEEIQKVRGVSVAIRCLSAAGIRLRDFQEGASVLFDQFSMLLQLASNILNPSDLRKYTI